MQGINTGEQSELKTGDTQAEQPSQISQQQIDPYITLHGSHGFKALGSKEWKEKVHKIAKDIIRQEQSLINSQQNTDRAEEPQI